MKQNHEAKWIVLASATAILGLWLAFGCATTPNPRPSTTDEVKLAVQTRVTYGLREYPETEQYVIYAALALRESAAGTNLAPDAVSAHVEEEAKKHDWPGSAQIQARLILHDALGYYTYNPTNAMANRKLLTAVADGINAGRQAR
jgi:hypothetical protein